MSDAAFTDSTTATPLPACTLAPISGNSTYTRSPSAACAWSEMPTRIRPSSSTRAHSWDLRNFRSPGISLMIGVQSLQWVGGGRGDSSASIRCRRCRIGGKNSDAVAGLAVAHERVLHQAHRQLASANVHADVAGLTGRDTREGHRLFQRRRETAREDLPLTVRGEHLMAVAKHALVVEYQADHHTLHAFGLLLLQRGATDEVAALVQRDGPAEVGLPRRDILVHVLAVQ